jgi:hypothetical protein
VMMQMDWVPDEIKEKIGDGLGDAAQPGAR